MKKAFSILLLLIFLFNMGGYYLLFWVLKTQANQELSLKLDEGDYNENETFEIKIPITLPYPLQDNDYERHSGQFNYKGEHYQLVKQKYENDTLTIVCVKDIQTKHLANVMDSFSEEASGNQPLKDGALNIPIKIFQEYVSQATTSFNTFKSWCHLIHRSLYLSDLNPVFLSIPSPPPWA